MARPFRRVGFWLIVALLVGITLPHYQGAVAQSAFLTHVMADLGLSRHAFERILYLMPIIWAGFLFGRRGVLITAIAALVCMLPRATFISSYPMDALMETGAVLVTGTLAGFSSALVREERKRRLQLAALNQISGVVSQSLELEPLLRGSMAKIVEVLEVTGVLVFLVDEEAGELVLSAHQGISRHLAEEVGRLRLGEGLNGMVATLGEPAYIEDTLQDPRLKSTAVREENIRSQLIVPLRAKKKVVGTLCVALHSQRRFSVSEVELLVAIGNQMGVAVENAQLYAHKERMEENLRFYLQQITRAQEEERGRVARELHDDTIQSLVGLARQLEDLAASESGLSPAGHDQLERLRVETTGIMDGVRRLSRDLRPPILDRLGLLPALDRLVSDLGKQSPIAIAVKVLGVERRLPAEVELILFRMAQEALSNVWRHAEATSVEVVVEFRETKTRITVRDDGKGFELSGPVGDLPRDGKLGLAGMHERARLLSARVKVESKLGKGTVVTIEAPV